jgi:hypothetical protein
MYVEVERLQKQWRVIWGNDCDEKKWMRFG